MIDSCATFGCSGWHDQLEKFLNSTHDLSNSRKPLVVNVFNRAWLNVGTVIAMHTRKQPPKCPMAREIKLTENNSGQKSEMLFALFNLAVDWRSEVIVVKL